MPSLEVTQKTVMRAIALGPDHVPDGLFRGRRSAVLRGLSVHANTISHARLIALEETFPLTRRLLGESAFNRLSRALCEDGHAGAIPPTRIGCDFPICLDQASEYTVAGSLARFEWAWLQCYHAPEAEALGLSELAGLGEVEIAKLVLASHPASIVLPLQAGVGPILGDEFGLDFGASHLLIARPEAEVGVAALSATGARLHAALASPQLVCNLLAEAAEPDAQEALLALVAGGTLVRAVEGGAPC